MSSERDNGPVTVIVKHKLRAGKQSLFEKWLLGIEKTCQSFNGFMGTEIIKPKEIDELSYVCIFRFDNFLNLENWMESNERAVWLAQSKEFSEMEPEYQHYQHHGMDILLGNTQHQAGNTISPLKMTFVTILGLALPVHFIPGIVASYVQFPIAITLISLSFIVPMMVFLIMPFFVKLFGRWLF